MRFGLPDQTVSKKFGIEVTEDTGPEMATSGHGGPHTVTWDIVTGELLVRGCIRAYEKLLLIRLTEQILSTSTPNGALQGLPTLLPSAQGFGRKPQPDVAVSGREEVSEAEL
jgi:hypothetical protein